MNQYMNQPSGLEALLAHSQRCSACIAKDAKIASLEKELELIHLREQVKTLEIRIKELEKYQV